jgi:tetratricopeptide (TPR) repeat protein
MPDTTAKPSDVDPRALEGVRLMQQGALGQAETLFRAVLHERPDDHQLHNALGAIAAQQGRFGEAHRLFTSARELSPDDAHAAGNLAALRQTMAVRAHEHVMRQDWSRALRAYREILALEPDHASAPNSIIHYVMASGEPPELADYDPDLDDADLGNHVFIACMPKSGSTFLKTALCALTTWPEAVLTYAYLQNEQELYLPYLRKVARENTVTQQHCRATEPNLQMMRAFQIRPIVLVRNLFDVVVSYTDFIDGGAKTHTFFAKRWDGQPRERRIDLMIDHFMPWYLAFFASWSDVQAEGLLDCHFLRYEDMNTDKLGTLVRLADFCDLGKTTADCEAALELVESHKNVTRFNKGEAGRGDELSARQKDRIRELASYYADIDFSPVGL